MIGLTHFLIVGVIVFSLGVFCVLTRRNAVGILLGLELMLNAANLNLLAFARFGGGAADGNVFVVAVIFLALAAVLVGLAIVLSVHRSFGTVDVRAAETLRG